MSMTTSPVGSAVYFEDVSDGQLFQIPGKLGLWHKIEVVSAGLGNSPDCMRDAADITTGRLCWLDREHLVVTAGIVSCGQQS
jgi:hypothetical protein